MIWLILAGVVVVGLLVAIGCVSLAVLTEAGTILAQDEEPSDGDR